MKIASNWLVDPWRDCRRRFDPHFYERQTDRSLPRDQVEKALLEGGKIPQTQKDPEKGQDYEVRWESWRIKTTLRPCLVILWTAFLQS